MEKKGFRDCLILGIYLKKKNFVFVEFLNELFQKIHKIKLVMKQYYEFSK